MITITQARARTLLSWTAGLVAGHARRGTGRRGPRSSHEKKTTKTGGESCIGRANNLIRSEELPLRSSSIFVNCDHFRRCEKLVDFLSLQFLRISSSRQRRATYAFATLFRIPHPPGDTGKYTARCSFRGQDPRSSPVFHERFIRLRSLRHSSSVQNDEIARGVATRLSRCAHGNTHLISKNNPSAS